MGEAKIPQKWRPTLPIIIGTIAGLFAVLPLFGFFGLIWLETRFGGGVALTLVTLAIAVGGVILAIALWRLLVRPIRALAATSADLMHNSVAEAKPLAQYGTAELRDLGQTVLEMAAALQNRTRAVQAYSDHVTHELKSPLTGLLGAVELLGDQNLPEAQQKLLIDDIGVSSKRMADLLDAMRAFGKAGHSGNVKGQTMICDLQAIRQDGVHVIGSPALPLSQEAAEIILSNLIRNAKAHDATRVDIVAFEGGIQVADNGSGMSEAHMSRVFDPFFTTRRDVGGTGMGLAIVKSLAESGGCTVDLWRKYGGIVIAIRP